MTENEQELLFRVSLLEKDIPIIMNEIEQSKSKIATLENTINEIVIDLKDTRMMVLELWCKEHPPTEEDRQALSSDITKIARSEVSNQRNSSNRIEEYDL